MNTENGSSATPVGEVAVNTAHRDGEFGVTQSWVGRTVVVTITGDLDLLTVPDAAEAIGDAVRRRPGALIVDLSSVEFLASAGMNLLLDTSRDAMASMRFGVVADGPATSRPIILMGIDPIVALYRSLDVALRDLG